MNRLEQLAQRPDLVFAQQNGVAPLGGGFYAALGDYRVGRMHYGQSDLPGLSAALCLLASDSAYPRWKSLDYRELENFLRVENDRPSLEDPSLEKTARRALADLKKNLLLGHFKRVLPRRLNPKRSVMAYIEAALGLEERVLRPFCRKFGLNWELFAVEGEEVVFRGGPTTDWELVALGDFIRYAFQSERLNIVAERG